MADEAPFGDRLGAAERRLDEHAQRLGMHAQRIAKLEAGSAQLAVQVEKLRQSISDMGDDVKLTIEHTFNTLLRDAINTVPGRVVVWFSVLTAAIALAAIIVPRFLGHGG